MKRIKKSSDREKESMKLRLQGGMDEIFGSRLKGRIRKERLRKRRKKAQRRKDREAER